MQAQEVQGSLRHKYMTSDNPRCFPPYLFISYYDWYRIQVDGPEPIMAPHQTSRFMSAMTSRHGRLAMYDISAITCQKGRPYLGCGNTRQDPDCHSAGGGVGTDWGAAARLHRRGAGEHFSFQLLQLGSRPGLPRWQAFPAGFP